MSSRFVTETELEERRKKRQDEWEKVRQPGQPEEAPEEEYDSRSLYDRLQEQKAKKQQEYEEAHKLKNMIKGLDDDEVDFLDFVDRTKIEEEKKKLREEATEIAHFRKAVRTLREEEEHVRLESKKEPAKKLSIAPKKNSQMQLLAGAVKRRSADTADEPKAKAAKTEDDESHTVSPKSSDEASSSDDKSFEKGRRHPACVAVLPGLGNYSQSSDSDDSSSSDLEEENSDIKYDLCGRQINDKPSEPKTK